MVQDVAFRRVDTEAALVQEDMYLLVALDSLGRQDMHLVRLVVGTYGGQQLRTYDAAWAWPRRLEQALLVEDSIQLRQDTLLQHVDDRVCVLR